MDPPPPTCTPGPPPTLQPLPFLSYGCQRRRHPPPGAGGGERVSEQPKRGGAMGTGVHARPRQEGGGGDRAAAVLLPLGVPPVPAPAGSTKASQDSGVWRILTTTNGKWYIGPGGSGSPNATPVRGAQHAQASGAAKGQAWTRHLRSIRACLPRPSSPSQCLKCLFGKCNAHVQCSAPFLPDRGQRWPRVSTEWWFDLALMLRTQASGGGGFIFTHRQRSNVPYRTVARA